MAAITGITGSASWGGSGLANHLLATGCSPMSFSLDVRGDEFDTTLFAVTQESSRIAGLYSWTGTIECQLQTPAVSVAAAISGPGYTANARSWSLNLTRRVHDVTPLTTAAARAFIGGVIDGSGTYECYYDSSTAAALPGAHSACVFTISTERTFTTNIVTTGPGVRSSPAEPVTISYPFVTSGAILANTNAGGDAPIVPDGTTTTGWVDDAQTLTLTSSTSQTFSGTAFWSSINIVCPSDSPTLVTIGFQGTGALTIG